MYPRMRTQGGFLLPVAIFLLVALGGLALAIARFTAQSGLSATQAMIDTQAFYAAESGAQYGMHRLFFKSAGGELSRAEADNRCAAMAGANLTFSGAGLNQCSSTVSCARTVDSGGQVSFYLLSSVAQCGSGEVRSVRTIEVSASMK